VINGLKVYGSLQEIPGDVDFAILTILPLPSEELWKNASGKESMGSRS